MGKYVVYVRAREERELEAAGLDVGEWVRDIVREKVDERIAGIRSGPTNEGGKRAAPTKERSAPESGGFQPDFRPGDLK